LGRLSSKSLFCYLCETRGRASIALATARIKKKVGLILNPSFLCRIRFRIRNTVYGLAINSVSVADLDPVLFSHSNTVYRYPATGIKNYPIFRHPNRSASLLRR
jgi:hypothetical protein